MEQPVKTYPPGPRLIFTRSTLFGLIGDPTFYAQVPAFAFLKTQAQAAHKQIVDALTGKSPCRGCDSSLKILSPVMTGFMAVVMQLRTDNPQALEPLYAFISTRLGYRPTPIVVYYKHKDGRQGHIEL
jgi:hypothetical protein